MIFINPYIFEIFKQKGLDKKLYIPELMAKIGHEYRHAWQRRNELFSDEFKERKLRGNNDIIDYMWQPIELDAASFEECILKVLTNNMDIMVDLPNEIIHREALELYHIYNERIRNEFENYKKV